LEKIPGALKKVRVRKFGDQFRLFDIEMDDKIYVSKDNYTDPNLKWQIVNDDKFKNVTGNDSYVYTINNRNEIYYTK
jgi:hypothetical protein